MERLVDFKRVYGSSIRAVEACLARLVPPMDRAEQETFLYSFFPFVYGIYPYAVATEKQSGAMVQAQVPMTLRPVCEIALTGIKNYWECENNGDAYLCADRKPSSERNLQHSGGGMDARRTGSGPHGGAL